MKKLKFGSVEILGYLGIAVWVAVVLLRRVAPGGPDAYRFMLGILPNLGAAWLATMFGKWAVLFLLKKNYTIQWHLLVCLGVVVLALGSEIVHDAFLNSPFDVYDMGITVIAQLVMFCLPLLTKDKYFNNYTG